MFKTIPTEMNDCYQRHVIACDSGLGRGGEGRGCACVFLRSADMSGSERKISLWEEKKKNLEGYFRREFLRWNCSIYFYVTFGVPRWSLIMYNHGALSLIVNRYNTNGEIVARIRGVKREIILIKRMSSELNMARRFIQCQDEMPS
jgi:hypothetical protein